MQPLNWYKYCQVSNIRGTPSIDKVKFSDKHFYLFRPCSVIFREYIDYTKTALLSANGYFHVAMLCIQDFRWEYNILYADPSCRAVWGEGLLPIACWDCGFESHRGIGCPFVVSVVCCQVEVCSTGRLLVERSSTDCGVLLCVMQKP